MFAQEPAQFGKILAEMTDDKILNDRRCIRCQPSREGVSPWVSIGGALLAIPKGCLKTDEWKTVNGKPDVYVLGEAAVRCGKVL
jgi:hypothetical protein